MRYILRVRTRSTPVIGMGTSVLFASLTLGVFALNQYSGPEAVTILFVEAVAAGDARQASSLVAGDPGIAYSIAQQVAVDARSSESFWITSVRRSGNLAVVSLTWIRGSATRTMMLPLVKTEAGWRIDARRTTWGLR